MQPALELGALNRVGAELDRPLVGALGAREVTGAPEQLGVRCVQRLVALERGILEQRLEQLEPGIGPGGKANGRCAVELDDRRSAELRKGAVQLDDLRPIGRPPYRTPGRAGR